VVAQKIVGADLLRSFACLAVFGHHLATAMHAPGLPSAVQAFAHLLDYGKFGVAVFFVLSGFLLGRPFWRQLDTDKPFALGSYAMLRLSRIAPAAWVCLLVSVAFDVFYRGGGNDFTIVRLLSGIVFVSDWHWLTIFPVDANGPLWSLSFEVSAYLFMPLVFVVCRATMPDLMRGWSGRYVWSGVILAGLLLHALATGALPEADAAAAADYGVGATAVRWFQAYNAFGFFAMFAIGTLIAGVKTLVPVTASRREVAQGALVLIAGTLVPTAVFAAMSRPLGIPMPPFAFPMAPLTTALFLYLAPYAPARSWLDNRYTQFLAEISFGVYIWHVLILIVVTDSLAMLAMPAIVRLALIAGLTLGATGLLSWASFKWFEAPIVNRVRDWMTTPSKTLASPAAVRPR